MNMKKRLFLNLLGSAMLLLMFNCKSKQGSAVLKIDSGIKEEALKNISTKNEPTIYSMDSIYESTYMAKNMAADTIVFDNLDNLYQKKNFMCNHYYDNDTLVIRGGFGARFQMYGFIAKVFPDQRSEVKLRLYWPYPSYFKTLDQEYAKSEVIVSTKESQLTLSNLPKSKNDRKHIYGLVQFISDPYYVEMKDPKTQKMYKEKNNFEFKIYFDSRYFDDSKLE